MRPASLPRRHSGYSKLERVFLLGPNGYQTADEVTRAAQGGDAGEWGDASGRPTSMGSFVDRPRG